MEKELMEMVLKIEEDCKESVNRAKENYNKSCNNPDMATMQNMITLKENEAKLKMVQYIIDRMEMKIESNK